MNSSYLGRYFYERSVTCSLQIACEHNLSCKNAGFRMDTKWFRNQISAGTIRRMIPALYPVILMGSCQEFSRQYLNNQTTVNIDAAVKELASATWRALREESEESS